MLYAGIGLALLAVVSILLIAYAVAGSKATESELLEARLAQFSQRGRSVQSLSEVELSLPFFERVFRPSFERLSGAMSRRISADQAQAAQERINLAGRPWGLTVGGLAALRVLSWVLFTTLGFGVGILLGFSGIQLFLCLVLGIVLGVLFPESMLSRAIRQRQHALLIALPSALDLMTISVEAGLGLDQAITRVTDKYHNALSIEFNQMLNEIRLGRPRGEALEDLGRRNKVEELNNFCQAIIQSEQLGVGIANVLRIQSEEIRRRRRQRAEEAGQKAPLKMLFPMVGCIFPTLFIVLLGPAILQVSDSIFK